MIITAPMQAAIASGSFQHNWLIYFTARNRATNANEVMGIWDGLDDISVVIDGVTKTFIGAGQLLSVPNWTFTPGIQNIQNQKLSLDIKSPEIINLIMAYDASLAPVQVYLMVTNTATMAVADAPISWFDGQVDDIAISESKYEKGCTVTIVSSQREGTRKLSTMKSEESQKLRNPDDDGFKYATIANDVPVPWGNGEGRQVR